MKRKKMGILTVIIWSVVVVSLLTAVKNINKRSTDVKGSVKIDDPVIEELVAEKVAEELARIRQEEEKTSDVVHIDNADGNNIEAGNGDDVESVDEIESDSNLIEEGPVSLFDCFALTNDWDKFCPVKFNVQDNIGQIHEKAHLFNRWYGEDKLKAILNKQYTTLEIPNVFLTEESKDAPVETYLVFSDQDGNELGVTPAFRRGVKPGSLLIDVTGVEDLSIEIKGDYGVDIGIDEAILY